MKQKTVFVNARLVMPYRITDNGYIVVCDGKICEIGQGAFAADGCRVIDVGGDYLSPGFVELHTHGCAGSDFMDGTAQAYLHCARFMSSGGVTTVYPTITTGSDKAFANSLAAFSEAAASNTDGAYMAGIHLEGPYFAYAMRGAQDPRFLRNPTPAEYLKILDSCDCIKRWSVAPELPGAIELGRELRRRGIVAAMGHTDGLFEQLMEAYENGYTLMTNF